MVRNWTFGRQLMLGYALAGLTLILVATAGYNSTSKLVENQQWVAHTYQVRQQFAELIAHLTDAETGQRGYVITGREEYLEPYNSGIAAVHTVFDHLRSLTADNPEQQRRLNEMTPVINARLASLASVIEARKAKDSDTASQQVIDGHGKELMDRLRAFVAAADTTEARLLEQRTGEARASSESAKLIILWGGLAGVVIVAIIGWFIIASLTRRVGGAVSSVQSSAAELQAAANQQASGTREQSSAMNEIATTIRELLATSRQIAESAQRVAHIAGETDGSARLGEDTVTRASSSVGAIRKQVDLIVNHMLDLGKKSQQAGTILEIVSELAEQTNILSINATIEAAGAGEAGKRFAIVADEIRKLADRVGGSTKEIRALIEDVRAAVNTTVMATETGSKAVDIGARQVEDVAASFRKITELVSTTTEAAREIELSTKQQSTAVEQVNVAIANVAQATKEAETSSAQTLQTASELSALSLQLARIIRREAHR